MTQSGTFRDSISKRRRPVPLSHPAGPQHNLVEIAEMGNLAGRAFNLTNPSSPWDER
jgi:hypothetical protein